MRTTAKTALAAARRLLFNLLAGNQDDHGKNHAFIYAERTRTWRLAPAFDLTHSPGLDRGMKIAGEAVPEWVRLEAWLKSGGIKPQEITESLEAVRCAVESWPEIARAHGVPAAQINEIASTHTRIAGLVG